MDGNRRHNEGLNDDNSRDSDTLPAHLADRLEADRGQRVRTCAQKGCPTLVVRGRCDVHAREIDRARGTAVERGYDRRWAGYSRRYRDRHPVCGEQTDGTLSARHSRCLQAGRVSPAECVDHIVPVSRGGSMWDPTNHQSLCLACNTAKGDR